MINIDLNKAKDIWRNKIRIDRTPVFEILDIEFLKALENNDIDYQTIIKQKKQVLRDAPSDPRIINAQSIEDLKLIDPIKEIW